MIGLLTDPCGLRLSLAILGFGCLMPASFADTIADCRRFEAVKRLPNEFSESASGLIPRQDHRGDDELFVYESSSCECHNRVVRKLDFPGTPDDAVWSCASLAERDRLAEEYVKAH